jgi:uncharacterized protein
VEFKWDEDRNRINIAKHGLPFDLAWHVFEGPVLEDVDDRFDYGETRNTIIGLLRDQTVHITYTYRIDCIRIISFRKATPNEQRAFYKALP